jgi:hypothetical protein
VTRRREAAQKTLQEKGREILWSAAKEMVDPHTGGVSAVGMVQMAQN